MNSALKWRDTIRESPVTALVATGDRVALDGEIGALPVSEFWQIRLPKRQRRRLIFREFTLDEDVGQLPRCRMMCAGRRMSRVGVLTCFYLL